MRAAGQLDTIGFPDDVSDPLRQLRIDLLVEEVEELRAALAADDVVEIADALADIIVVAYGTILAYCGPNYFNGMPPQITNRSVSFDQMVNDYLFGEAESNSGKVELSLLRLIARCEFELRDRFGLVVAEEILGEVARSNLSKIPADGRIVRRDDGKVLKPDTFSPPDIRSILESEL